MYKIYKIKNKKHPSEIYIGSTKRTLKERFQNHTTHKRSSVYQYIQRDGRENFEITIIDYAENKKEAFEKERFWTLFFKEQGYFMYNKQAGSIPTQETLEKLRIANTGKHMSEEARKKISKSMKGENNPFFGKHHTQETKEKISKKFKENYIRENHPFFGRHHTEETKQKISKKQKERFKDPTKNPMYGKHLSEEAKAKISKANKGRLAGENHPLFGKHLSEETKEKISKSRKGKLLNGNHPRARKIRCIDDNKIFDCIKDAADFYNASISAIINNCKKKSKSCAGHHFEYI